MSARVRSGFGILLAVVLLCLGVYGLQNQEHVGVRVLFWDFGGTQAWIPAGIFTFTVFFLCLLYGALSGTVWQVRRRRLVKASTEHQSRVSSLAGDLEASRAEVVRLRKELESRPPAPSPVPADRAEQRPVAALAGEPEPAAKAWPGTEPDPEPTEAQHSEASPNTSP